MGVWVSRLLIGTPIDILFLKRATGLGLRQQFAGTLHPLIAAAGMAALVLAVGQGPLQSLPAITRLFVEGSVGVAGYVGLMLLIERPLTRQFFSFVRQAATLRA
jgi:hypothetical protein